jgi:tellurite resistance-related uncharacterized protein
MGFAPRYTPGPRAVERRRERAALVQRSLRERLLRGRLPAVEPVISAPPVPRTIIRWRRDGSSGEPLEASGAVVLRLDCGHDRHVHHRPPLSSHPWVLDDAACDARVGAAIECLRCGQRLVPEDARPYRRTAGFDEHTIPAGLLGEHSTKAGTWGRLVVEQGQLAVWFLAPLSLEVAAEPGAPVAIPPQLRHQVRLRGPVRFHVEFLRVADDG